MHIHLIQNMLDIFSQLTGLIIQIGSGVGKKVAYRKWQYDMGHMAPDWSRRYLLIMAVGPLLATL
jgi:hypothetical protein